MNVLILTGAGISAESGIPTFRGAGGLWEGWRVEEVATPEAFRLDPERVHRFYNQRRQNLRCSQIQPNAAHIALAEFEKSHSGEFLLVTQNIDDLHQRAGSRKILAMHGELMKARCLETGALFDCEGDLSVDTPHPLDPSRRGCLRPPVVWFGEMPIGMDRIAQAASRADVFVAIGTSSLVYPAASIVQWTQRQCRRVEINLEDTPQSQAFALTLRGTASTLVPEFLACL